jgi:hypothetical protein
MTLTLTYISSVPLATSKGSSTGSVGVMVGALPWSIVPVMLLYVQARDMLPFPVALPTGGAVTFPPTVPLKPVSSSSSVVSSESPPLPPPPISVQPAKAKLANSANIE